MLVSSEGVKELRRPSVNSNSSNSSSGYGSQLSSDSTSSRKSTCSTASFGVYKLPEFSHIKSKVDTGWLPTEIFFCVEIIFVCCPST